MKNFRAALWAETLKARRSRITPLTAGGLALAPLVSGLFMVILKDPEQARALGLIGTKAQLAGGTADWPTFYSMLLQATAIAGMILFSFITAWLFGREFSDHTAKELLALPTPRTSIIAAKFALAALWMLALALMIFTIGMAVGRATRIPGWSPALEWGAFVSLLFIAMLTFLLMPFVALFASLGRGYLPAMGWAFLTLALAQILAVLGWGGWFPWSVPALYSGMAGERSALLGLHSYIMVGLAFVVGAALTFVWWQQADQA